MEGKPERTNDFRITDWQLRMLSQIFRVIVKEIVTDDDKEKLAPGEIGIHYGEGAFYIRNPHTGELFSPNSLSNLNQLLSKFNPRTGRLNADYVSNIRFYSDIHQLDDLGISLTPDSIIRQMAYPAILVSPVAYDNYSEMGFPSSAGIVTVAKITEDYATIEYYDCNSFVSYEGKYNRFNHLFEGWISTSATSSEHVDTVGGGNLANIAITTEIKDMLIISVRVTEDLEPGANIAVNNRPAVPIINADGSRLAQTIAANNIIMLIYDERRDSWVLIPSGTSAIEGLVTLVNERTSEVETAANRAVAEAEERLSKQIEELRKMLLTRPGNVETEIVDIMSTTETTEIRRIGRFNPAVDKLLVVNYGQTVLRRGIDYEILDADKSGVGGVKFINNITIHPDDVVQFIILKQDPVSYTFDEVDEKKDTTL